MAWKSRSKEWAPSGRMPGSKPCRAACQRSVRPGQRRGSTREEYSVSVEHLGTALRSVKTAMPSSRVSGVMCDGRPMPQSLSASREQKAHPAGIMNLSGSENAKPARKHRPLKPSMTSHIFGAVGFQVSPSGSMCIEVHNPIPDRRICRSRRLRDLSSATPSRTISTARNRRDCRTILHRLANLYEIRTMIDRNEPRTPGFMAGTDTATVD